ncbi:hypothetical protein CHS0354_000812 [Potamilus streckersoni]|uniref:4Fe-4S ferredoxin-type domain-containing protein n=1 Tax=Potamilus streckersoni TaxID=2493646 RepID=A0AAE0W7N2_9BIVA|nr:hypothetical protein CHS0354_000812 [Potamilus streckersoni]
MAIHYNKKHVHKLSFFDKLYIPRILFGMIYTFKQMFARKITTTYPDKKWIPSSIFRGRPVLVEREDHTGTRCVACGLCARVCPPLAINIQANETLLPQERQPETFEIDMLRCIFCGYCEEICPEEAIIMSSEYDITFSSREEAIFNKEKLLISAEQAKARIDFLKNFKNKPPKI